MVLPKQGRGDTGLNHEYLEVAEWQTRSTKDAVGEIPCGFKSHLRDHAELMKLADIADLESAALCVWVQVPYSAPNAELV